MAEDVLEEAVLTFYRAARLMDGMRLHVWDERGLTLPQLRMLFRVREQPGVGVRELAQAFDVSASNISQQMEKLVSRGLVERAERPEDRRQVAHTLTDDGETAASEISHEGGAYLRALIGALSPADQARLTRILQTLLDAAGVEEAVGTSTPAGAGRG